MRLLLSVLGWFGVLLMAAAGLPAFSSSLTLLQTGSLGSGAGYFLTFLVGLLGSLMIVPADLIRKSKALAIAAVAVGVVYVATFFGYVMDFELRMLGGILFMLIPALLSIAAGFIVLRRTGPPIRQRAAASNGRDNERAK